MADLNDFIKEEESDLNALQRMIKSYYPTVNSTQQLAAAAGKINPVSGLVIKQSRAPKILTIFFVCFFGLVGLNNFIIDDSIKSPVSTKIIGVCVYLVASYIVVRLVVFDKRRSYNIIINSSTFTIENTTYLWADIIETYIMHRKEGKVIKYYLVLNTRAGGFKKYSLSKYSFSPNRLSAFIEYFKGEAIKVK